MRDRLPKTNWSCPARVFKYLLSAKVFTATYRYGTLCSTFSPTQSFRCNLSHDLKYYINLGLLTLLQNQNLLKDEASSGTPPAALLLFTIIELWWPTFIFKAVKIQKYVYIHIHIRVCVCISLQVIRNLIYGHKNYAGFLQSSYSTKKTHEIKTFKSFIDAHDL